MSIKVAGGGWGGPESGKVSPGEGRVKVPQPDGLLTLRCPASPIPAGAVGGRGEGPAAQAFPTPTRALRPRR